MKAITVQISDEDYEDLVSHLAKDSAGTPLVGVRTLAGPRGSFLERDIRDRVEALGLDCPAILAGLR